MQKFTFEYIFSLERSLSQIKGPFIGKFMILSCCQSHGTSERQLQI